MCQPKFLPEAPSADSSQENSKKRKAPSSATNRTRVLSLEELQENFHLPINEVACKLGVCVTVLKQQCRELGIVRWPYRKVRKLDNMLTALETAGPGKARPFALTNGEDDRQRKIVTVKKTLRELVANPNSCAHLKLGKVKNAATGATAGAEAVAAGVPSSTTSSMDVLEKLGSHVFPNEGLLRSISKGLGAPSLSVSASDVWAAQSEAPSASGVSTSEEQGSGEGAAELAAARALVCGPQRSILAPLRAGRACPEQANLAAISVSPEAAPAYGPGKDLEDFWLKSSGVSASSGTPAKGPLGLEDMGKELHLGPEGAAVTREFSAVEQCSRMGSDAANGDAEESVHGGALHSSRVELDLISRLGGSASRPSMEEEDRSSSLLDRGREDSMPTSPVEPVSASLISSLPGLSLGAVPARVVPAAEEALQLQGLHSAMQQPQHQHQLFALLGYPAAPHISPPVLKTAVDAMNVQRNAMIAAYSSLVTAPFVTASAAQASAQAQALSPSVLSAWMQQRGAYM